MQFVVNEHYGAAFSASWIIIRNLSLLESLMIQTCQTCGARCCRYFCFEIDKPSTYQEFENVRWYLLHEGVTVHIDLEGDWYIAIANRCLNLGKDDRCVAYTERPLICRQYDTEGCDFTKGDYEYQALFTTAEQVENYARAKLGAARFEKIKASARQRVEKQRAAAMAEGKRKGTAATRKKPPAYLARTRRSRPAKCCPLSRLFA